MSEKENRTDTKVGRITVMWKEPPSREPETSQAPHCELFLNQSKTDMAPLSG